MYADEDTSYYETMEPAHKRPKLYTEVKEQKCFQLVHRAKDEPGHIKLVLPEPITLDADTTYAAVALQNITYMKRWRNLEEGALAFTFYMFNSTEDDETETEETETEDDETETYHEVYRLDLSDVQHFKSLQEVVNIIRTVVCRNQKVPIAARGYVDDYEKGFNVGEYLKIELFNNVLSFTNDHATIGFKFEFCAAFVKTFGIEHADFNVDPLEMTTLQFNECVQTNNEIVTLHLAGLKTTATHNGSQSLLHSFTNKNTEGGFNNHYPSPQLEFKELQVPCIIRDFSIHVENINREVINFSADLLSHINNLQHQDSVINPIDCVINIVLVTKTLQ